MAGRFTPIRMTVVAALVAVIAVGGAAYGWREWRRSEQANVASCLACCYNAHCFIGPDPRVISSARSGDTVTSFAGFFAGRASMNVADLWFIRDDKSLAGVRQWPEQVADLSNPTRPVIDPLFARTGPKSYAVVVDMPHPETLEAHASTYPVVWTRGLREKGWIQDSPFGGDGGHVAYLDGHVRWYSSTVDKNGVGVFKDYQTGEPTSDIRKAIGPGAKVLEDR